MTSTCGRPIPSPAEWTTRAGVRQVYGLPAPPERTALAGLAEPWRPYRSVATWYFWRSRGFVPQS
jgi:DNA-3-methyladenine glycosylase II